MIDTICLLIPKDKVVMLDLTNQGVSGWDLQSRTNEYDRFVKNPSKRDLESGKYYPRLTGYKRKYRQEANIRIEFSVPKLLFMNNLEELEETDFDEVVNVLQSRLRDMGMVASEYLLKNCSVSAVHFGKNIKLNDGHTVSQIISEMNKIDLRKSFDFARARFINNGESLYAHTTAHQFVVYDKIADLKKDEKRAIDKDQTECQQSLFWELEKRPEKLEIIRFEVRLSQKVKMNSILEKVGYKKNPTFQDIFKKDIAQKVVQHYWQTIIKERNLGLFTVQSTHKDILRAVYKAEPKIKPNRAIYLTGLLLLAKDVDGMREIRSITHRKSNERTWFRIAKDVRHISLKLSKNKVRDWVSIIDTELAEYKTLKIKPKDI
jgi:hypothetical protein